MEDNIKYTDDFIKLWNNRPWHLKQISDKTKAFNWYNEGKKSGKCKELEEEIRQQKSQKNKYVKAFSKTEKELTELQNKMYLKNSKFEEVKEENDRLKEELRELQLTEHYRKEAKRQLTDNEEIRQKINNKFKRF